MYQAVVAYYHIYDIIHNEYDMKHNILYKYCTFKI